MESGNVTAPGVFSEFLGQAAYAFSEVQPYLPMYLHLILSALFPIFTGAHSSLTRPSSAAKPPKKSKKEHGHDEEDDDDEESIQKMEGLSNSDAIMFPLLAGSTLAGLYFLIKWMGPALINKVLNWYFSAMAIFSVGKLLNDSFAVVESFCWPQYYADDGVIWKVNSSQRRAVEINHGSDHTNACSRSSPLPGILGRVSLPPSISSLLWFLRDLPSTKYSLCAHVAKIVSFKVKVTLRTIFSAALGLVVVLISNFVSKAWWLTNLQGFAFSYSALQLMSPTTFGTGSLILAALFFYDIYFVFFTPMMVTVATNLDVPIKLLFPRPPQEGETVRKLAMLGLGDIVLPGIMIGLALRFDLYMHYLKKQTKSSSPASAEITAEDQEKPTAGSTIRKEPYRSVTSHWGNSFWTSSWTGRSLLFAAPPPTKQASPTVRRALIPTFSKPYFYASIVGYVAGMCATLGVMQVFRHAQPALLYLVPGVLTSVWLTALLRGELKQMRDFSDASEEEPEDEKKRLEEEAAKKDDKTSKSDEKLPWWKDLLGFQAKDSNTKRTENKSTNNTEKGDGLTKPKSKGEDEKDNKQKSGDSASKESFSFSITRVPHSWQAKRKASSPPDSDDAAVVVDSKSDDNTPRWRGAKLVDGNKEERPGKRLRTS